MGRVEWLIMLMVVLIMRLLVVVLVSMWFASLRRASKLFAIRVRFRFIGVMLLAVGLVAEPAILVRIVFCKLLTGCV
jgi:hypothetical protein